MYNEKDLKCAYENGLEEGKKYMRDEFLAGIFFVVLGFMITCLIYII